MCKAQHCSLRERMNEKEVWMEQEGVGSMGSAESLRGVRGSRCQWGGSRGPRSSQLNALGFHGKAESEREITGRLSHPIG